MYWLVVVAFLGPTRVLNRWCQSNPPKVDCFDITCLARVGLKAAAKIQWKASSVRGLLNHSQGVTRVELGRDRVDCVRVSYANERRFCDLHAHNVRPRLCLGAYAR